MKPSRRLLGREKGALDARESSIGSQVSSEVHPSETATARESLSRLKWFLVGERYARVEYAFRVPHHRFHHHFPNARQVENFQSDENFHSRADWVHDPLADIEVI